MSGLVCALHGFLGRGADWDFLADQRWELLSPSLFSDCKWDLSSFDSIADQVALQTQKSHHTKKLFVGYSLGGRIGLHILSRYPDLFDQYIFISTNPGLIDNDDKLARAKNDNIWADLIQNIKTESNWNEFLQQWDSQSVLQGRRQEPQRQREHFDLDQLQDAMTHLSLSKQKNFVEVLKMNQKKIFWLTGEQDTKFSDMAEDLLKQKILLRVNCKRILNSGHRVLFDQPSEILSLVSAILS